MKLYQLERKFLHNFSCRCFGKLLFVFFNIFFNFPHTSISPTWGGSWAGRQAGRAARLAGEQAKQTTEYLSPTAWAHSQSSEAMKNFLVLTSLPLNFLTCWQIHHYSWLFFLVVGRTPVKKSQQSQQLPPPPPWILKQGGLDTSG